MRAVTLTNELSRFPVFLTMVSETGVSRTGTGFFYEYEGIFYLITNGHNVTGINPEINRRISADASFPIMINIFRRIKAPVSLLPKEQLDGIHSVIDPEHATIRLYGDDDYIQPLWYVHPEYGHRVDVIAIPLGKTSNFHEDIQILPINKYADFEAEPEVADDVFILGYPFDTIDFLFLPIWKKGSIATEPSMLYEGLPRMLVDTASRPGMSGSPVILRRTGLHNTVGGELTPDSTIGTVLGFVGVYSGRVVADKNSATEGDLQLGIVWRKEVIEEILLAKTLATNSFQHIGS